MRQLVLIMSKHLCLQREKVQIMKILARTKSQNGKNERLLLEREDGTKAVFWIEGKDGYFMDTDSESIERELRGMMVS